MSDINFLSNDEKKNKNTQSKKEDRKIDWTNPGEFKVEKDSVEDIFAESEKIKKAPEKEISNAPAQRQVQSKTMSFFKSLFKSGGSAGIFKKRKEDLRDYREILETETLRRKDHAGNKKDQWHAPNIIKTNLIHNEANDSLDWSENINKLSFAVGGAFFLLSAFYLGLQMKESFMMQKGQEITQEIQDVKMQIISAKNGLGDIDSFQKKLDIAGNLLNKHIYWTNFFGFLEENLIKDAYIVGDFAGDTSGEYSFTVVTDSYSHAANQIKLLREYNEDKIIKEMQVTQASFNEPKQQPIGSEIKADNAAVTFNVDLKIDQKIFYKK